MFNVTAMRILLKEAKRKAMRLDSSYEKSPSHGSQPFVNETMSLRGGTGVVNKLDDSFFASINASLQKDIAILLSISDLDAHSLWLKTAHDRKKLIKEVQLLDTIYL